MLTKKKELYNRRRQRSEIDRILQKQRAFLQKERPMRSVSERLP